MLTCKYEVKLDESQYTFMGWNQTSLLLLPYNKGNVFPAFLTWRAGVSKRVVTKIMQDVNSGKGFERRRHTMDDVSIGNTVDLVPMHGSVSCMATRAATGIIVDVAECESPDNITPRLARAGNGTVAIKIVEIYSPGFKVPAYTYQHLTVENLRLL